MTINNKQQSTEKQHLTKDQRRQENHNRDADGMRRALLGKPVFIVFTDGKSITGVLRGLSTYTFMVERNGADLFIYKHSIRYVRLAKGDEV